MSRRMKVAVYSGSFNPMHIGHIAVIEYLLSNGGFDMVYLVVSPHNPFKDSSMRNNARERFLAACEAIKRRGLDKVVKVEDLELHRAVPSYTIETLDELKSREPSKDFSLVIGGDNLANMFNWRNGERILCDYGVVVYPREGSNADSVARKLRLQHQNAENISGRPHKPLHIKILKEAPQVDVSSTMIRELMSKGMDVSHLLA